MGKGILVFLATLITTVFLAIVIILAGLSAYSKSDPDSVNTHIYLLALLFIGVPVALIGLYFGQKEKNENLAKGFLWGGIFWLILYGAIALFLWLPGFLENSARERKYKEDVKAGKYQRLFFKRFISKFKTTSLPYKYRLTSKTGGNLSEMVKLENGTLDTMFVKTKNLDETYCFGVISDTTDFYSVIYFFPAYYYYPVLATYTKTGEFINQKPLIINACDAACGLSYCSQTAELGKNFFIKSTDSTVYNSGCKGQNILDEDSALLQVYSRNGNVNKAGKIELGKVLGIKKTVAKKP